MSAARVADVMEPAPGVRPAHDNDGPLSGLRVIELGTLIAGPFATRLLSDLGADVIKVEAPGRGDPMRDWGTAKEDGRSLWWPVQSRGKRLITLDLRGETGQELCREIAVGADVLVENFRPGTMERWGLGPEQLARVNPRLIYARISGYGQTGPYAERGGFASAGEALSGMRYLNGFPGEAPPRTGLSLGDSLAGMFAALGVLAALQERHTSGRGQVIDASILESCFAVLESVAPEFHRLGAVRQPTGTALSNNAPSNVYKAADGRWVVIAANSNNLFPKLCEAIGRPDVAADPRFATHDGRGEHEAELDAVIGAWAAEHDAVEIDRLLNAAQVVCAPVNTIADVFADPHVMAREMLVEVMDSELGSILGPGVVPKLSRTPGRRHFSSSWTSGAHNDQVYGDLLGLNAEALEALSLEGVI